MNNVNIFEVAKENKMPKWAKFKNAGDSIQGTYIGKIANYINSEGRYKTPQNIYQLLREGDIYNIGFTLNKKNIHKIMDNVPFGQIVGFLYKGEITIPDKLNPESTIVVKDYAVYTDSKIKDVEWLKENADYMPKVIEFNANTHVRDSAVETEKALQEFSKFGANESSPVPSTTAPASITPEDKLAVIIKLAHDKLGVSDVSLVKDQVMTATGIAFLPNHYDAIISALNSIGA